jgi:tRNA (guanine37-N1)-methyltransferase
MTFHIITLFPEVFESYFNASIFGRAQKKKSLTVKTYQLRDFSPDTKHHKVDDKPFGGGPGMVLQIEPIATAVDSILNSKRKPKLKSKKTKTRTILFSTRGKLFTHKEAQRLSKYDHLIFICGRYEGVDERVAQYIADEELSVGDVVLSGGEIPAMLVMDAIGRLIPGVLGKYESLEDIKGSYPVYTRPEVFYPDKKNNPHTQSGSQLKSRRIWRAPQELLSGDPKKINAWREKRDI